MADKNKVLNVDLFKDEELSTPLVSIACLTFNHVQYIEQCFDGFLMQQTNFNVEIVVYDDASTDGNQDVIRNYELKYSGKFNVYYQTENQYSKGVRGLTAKFTFPRCKGKYIALCEGDDYWTDPLKLQKQVDFLEEHPDYIFSMGRVNFLHQHNGKLNPKNEFVNPSVRDTYTLKDYLKQPFSQTSTFLFRNRPLEIPDWISKVMAGDQTLVVLIVGNQGKIKFHDDYFSVYRVNDTSITQRNLSAMLKNNFSTFRYWNEHTNYEYDGLIKSRIFENRILYYVFKPKFVQKLYKNYMVESILQFVYKGIMWFKK